MLSLVSSIMHGDLEAHAAEHGADQFPVAGDEEDDVAFLDVRAARCSAAFSASVKNFQIGDFLFAALALDEGEALDRQAGLDGHFVEPVHLAGGDAGEALGIDRPDHAAAFEMLPGRP